MMELAFVFVVIGGLMWVYHIGNEHGKEKSELSQQIVIARTRADNAMEAIGRKNAYIKKIESALVDRADASGVATVLTRMFKDQDDLPTGVVHSGGASPEAKPSLRVPGRTHRIDSSR
jgi:enamine deaminase RidA (YjgF/YER057c/UK114 family)